jgi:hypothetical protein
MKNEKRRAHTYNPTTWEAEIGRIVVQGQTRQKVNEIPSEPTNQVWWCTPVIQATQEA